MASVTIEFWLVLQLVVEVVLCGVIAYYLFRERSQREALRVEREKIKALLESLQHLVTESKDLDEKHQRLLELWGKVEKRGAAIEAYVEDYKRELASLPHSPQRREGEERESSARSYAKASRLIEQGAPIEEIAHTVGLPRGEIELIMNLKKQ
jgi:hypothetical protein